MVPIIEEVSVPFEMHRSLIGTRGSNVRELMNKFDVQIDLQPPEMKSDIIKIIGIKDNILEAKKAILQKVEEFEASKRDRELRSFEIKLDILPEYHSKIIGRKGAVVNKLRADFDVNITLPKAGDENDRIVTITGYMQNANDCKDEILKMVSEYDELITIVVDIDSRVHRRLIGNRGKNIRKMMEDYKVDIRIPKPTDANKDAVTITGQEEDVENARDHLLNLEEEYLQDVTDITPFHRGQTNLSTVFEQTLNTTGFVVKDAPWERQKELAPNTQSQVDFPDFGGKNNETSPPISTAWGGRH